MNVKETSPGSADVAIGKLRWRCRRGMRELDAAMLAYLDHHYKDADDDEQHQFRQLLELQDPELMGLVSGKHSNPAFDTIIERICGSLKGRDKD